ncbi:ABC transporter permease [Lactobacillus isalae]|uniref:ABC transporter permease n=1 Tax=Lactobacillus isalae TaxID=2993455 RepID=UPI0024A7AB91|nr:ABC-2 family transporter protein [Lactobacillus isalae]
MKLKNKMSSIKSYYFFSLAELKQNYLAYKSRFMLWVFANTIVLLVQLFLWLAIYNNASTATINGFSKMEILNYCIISKIIEAFTYVSFEAKVAKDLDNGNITMNLIKPINYRVELFFRAFGSILGSIVLFVPVYVLIWLIVNKFKVYFCGLQSLLFFISLINAFLLNYFICLICSSFLIKTIKSKGIYFLKLTIINFLSGAFFPLAFLPFKVHQIINFLPFIQLRSVPIEIFMRRIIGKEIFINFFISIFWIFIFYQLSSYLWNRQLKKLESFGG